MPRLPLLSPDTAPEAARGLLTRLPPLHVFGALAHAPAAFEGFVRMGNALLYKGRLDPALRELTILRVAHLAGADYERHHHEDAARQLGVDAALIAATAVGSAHAAFDPRQRAALRYAEELAERVKARAEVWAEVAACFAPDEQVELTLTIGYYMMVARFLENMEISVEAEGQPGLRFDAPDAGAPRP